MLVHLRRQHRAGFLAHLRERLGPGTSLLLIDQNEVPGFGAPIVRRDLAGNSYEARWLDSGERFEIVKNYPDDAELTADLAAFCDGIAILRLDWFWAVSARLRPADRGSENPAQLAARQVERRQPA